MHTLYIVRVPGSTGDQYEVGEVEYLDDAHAPSNLGPGYLLHNARTLSHVDDPDHLDHIAENGPSKIAPLGKEARDRFLPMVFEAISCTVTSWAHCYDFSNGTWRTAR